MRAPNGRSSGRSMPSIRRRSTPFTPKPPMLREPLARRPARRPAPRNSYPPSPTNMPTIHLAHSPDSDDAFMFWALAAGKIDTGDRRYVHELADIESLNRRALAGELEVTAVSLHAYAYLADRYALLAHGASIGDRYGPRIVARVAPPSDPRVALAGRLVAVPGEMTTACLTLRLYQTAARHVVVPFDQIEDYVA